MNICIDGYGLAKYLTDMLSKIRRDKDADNNSIFNINTDVWDINQVFVKQSLCATFWTQEEAPDILKKDLDFDNSINKSHTREQIIKALERYMPKGKSERKDFIDDLDNWIKSSTQLSFKPFSKEDDILNSSSAIYIMKDRKDDYIDINRIIDSLKNIFFVEKTSLNTIRFTQDLKGWGVVRHALENERDIVIVDRYFFQPNGKSSNIEESLLFIEKAICSADKVKNIIIFYENDKKNLNRDTMDALNNDSRIKAKCKIIFVAVNSKLQNEDNEETYINKVLHDRYILSNYRIICSGHSFVQYFKNDVFSAHGSMFMTIGSIADKSNETVMEKSLQFLQKEILNRKKEGAYFIHSIDNMYESNLLSLPKAK